MSYAGKLDMDSEAILYKMPSWNWTYIKMWEDKSQPLPVTPSIIEDVIRQRRNLLSSG